MVTFQTKEMASPTERQQANRSRVYSFLAESFRYPTAEFKERVSTGGYHATLRSLVSDLPYSFSEWQDRTATLRISGQYSEEIEVEFCRLFEIGPAGPPCALVEGSYREDRKVVLKELILFYNHFGLSYSAGAQDERPDHLCTEMEFLHYLTFKEVQALQNGSSPGPYRRAEKDFIERHTGIWIPQVAQRVEKIRENCSEDACTEVLCFYANLLALTDCYLRKELEYLRSIIS